MLWTNKKLAFIYVNMLVGDIGIYGMAVLAYFSYGISVFSLKNCGAFAILDSKTAVIDKICLRYYGFEFPPMPPSWCNSGLNLRQVFHVSRMRITEEMKL